MTIYNRLRLPAIVKKKFMRQVMYVLGSCMTEIGHREVFNPAHS